MRAHGPTAPIPRKLKLLRELSRQRTFLMRSVQQSHKLAKNRNLGHTFLCVPCDPSVNPLNCYTFLYVPRTFLYVPPCFFDNSVKMYTFLYVLCNPSVIPFNCYTFLYVPSTFLYVPPRFSQLRVQNLYVPTTSGATVTQIVSVKNLKPMSGPSITRFLT